MISSFIIKSVCTFTAITSALMYLLYMKQKSSNNQRRVQIKKSRQASIEIKIPKNYVVSIIGRGGLQVKQIQEETQTQIFFKNQLPDDSDRICVIRGKPENLILAESLIQNIISSQPVVNSFEMHIPNNVVGRLIGLEGNNIRRIQKLSKTRVSFDSNIVVIDSVQMVKIIIKGTEKQIAACVTLIEHDIQEDSEFGNLPEDIIKYIKQNTKHCNVKQSNHVENEKDLINEDDSSYVL